jgi:RHS repeat-associated protein
MNRMLFAWPVRFAYDGLDAIADQDATSGAVLRRYVFDPVTDQPIVQYDGTGTTTRKFLSADERGSIIASSDNAGALVGINSYDEYGRPGASNTGLFQYTGQKWIGVTGAYDYKARVYFPHLGTFAQTDPVGYDAAANLYAYVGGDPVNWIDPSGTCPTGFVLVRNHGPATTGPGGSVVISAGTCLPVSSVLRQINPTMPTGDGHSTEITVCPVAVDAKITGVGPNQANSSKPTAISGTPGNEIKAGSVAIDPLDFGVPSASGGARQALGKVALVPVWAQAKRPPNGAPAIPRGLPSTGPYNVVDVIGPASARNKPGLQIDLYRYQKQAEALAATRIVPVIAVIPWNNAGVTCPTGK